MLDLAEVGNDQGEKKLHEVIMANEEDQHEIRLRYQVEIAI